MEVLVDYLMSVPDFRITSSFDSRPDIVLHEHEIPVAVVLVC